MLSLAFYRVLTDLYINRNKISVMIKEEETTIVRSFAERVRGYRECLGLSQEKLAEKADIHRTYMGSLERSEKIPSLITIVKLAKALNVNVSELINI